MMQEDNYIERLTATMIAKLDLSERDRVEAATSKSAPRIRSTEEFKTFKAEFRSMPVQHRNAAVSYWTNCVRAGLSPLPVTRAKMDSAYAFVRAAGKRAAEQCRAAWPRAFHQLPQEAWFRLVPTGEDLLYKKARAASFSERIAVGLPRLWRELGVWQEASHRPTRNHTDPHEPLRKKDAKVYKRYLGQVALSLYEIQAVRSDVSLKALLVRSHIDKWLRLTKEKDEYLIAMVVGVTRISSDTLGGSHDVSKYLRSLQADLRPGAWLSDTQVVALRKLSAANREGKLQGLAQALMIVAFKSTTATASTKVNLATVAVGIVVQLEHALRPGVLAALVLTDDHGVWFPTQVQKAEGPIAVSARLQSFIEHFRELQRRLGRARTQYLFGKGGAYQTVDMVDRHLSNAIRLSEVPTFTWQMLRDLAAVQMIKDNPDALMRLTDLLDLQTRNQVVKRFGPLLPGGSGGKR